MVIVDAQQVVAQLELGRDVVAGLIALCELGQCHGVLVVELVVQLARHGGKHRVVVFLVDTVAVLLIYREVRHAHVGDGQQVAVVFLVLGVSQRDVGFNLDTVADEVVQVDTRGESVELLLNDRTGLMVVTSTDAEVSLLAATAQCKVVVLTPTRLLDFAQPVSIVVVHLILREAHVVVQLGDVTRSVAQLRIEVLFLQQHGILVTIQHLVALRLVGAGQTSAEADAGLTACTALGLDFNHTVRTL